MRFDSQSVHLVQELCDISITVASSCGIEMDTLRIKPHEDATSILCRYDNLAIELAKRNFDYCSLTTMNAECVDRLIDTPNASEGKVHLRKMYPVFFFFFFWSSTSQSFVEEATRATWRRSRCSGAAGATARGSTFKLGMMAK